MQHQSSATIFLADGYHIFQTEDWRSISIPKGQPVLKYLTAIKDETLTGEKSASYHSSDSIILLPIVGNIIACINGAETEIICGEMLVVNAACSLKVINPYKEHLVNYLLVYFDKNLLHHSCYSRYTFDLEQHKNEFTDVLTEKEIRLSIGKLEMRREAMHYSNRHQKSSFCFVIQGSFEIEGRLLHERDALAVWDTDHLDIESLGRESILLLIELTT